MTVSSYSQVTIHTHPDDKTAHSAVVEKGGILEIFNDDHDFPDFEVEFRNSAPPSPNDSLTGTVDKPIVLNMPHELKEFHYYILYKHRDGKCIRGLLLYARTCGPCP